MANAATVNPYLFVEGGGQSCQDGISFDKEFYDLDDTALITVTDPNFATNSDIDEATVHVISDTLSASEDEILVTVIETGVSTGILQGSITFSTTPTSDENVLYVTLGDEITAYAPCAGDASDTAVIGAMTSDLYVSSRFTNEVLRYNGVTGEFIDSFLIGDICEGVCVSEPHGLTFGPDGHLYVASKSNDQIIRYNGVTGELIDFFAPPCSFPGCGDALYEPRDIIFGPDGNLYVAQRFTNEVLRFDGDTGDFIDVFAQNSDCEFYPCLEEPNGLTFGPDGNLYVSSRNSDEVLRFDGDTGEFIDSFLMDNLCEGSCSGIDEPRALTFGPDDDLFVTNRGPDPVLRYDGNTGEFMGAFVTEESGGIDDPVGLVFGGPVGDLYVSSRLTNEVLRYDRDTGEFMGAFVTEESGGGLTEPFGLVFGPPNSISSATILFDSPDGTYPLPGTAVLIVNDLSKTGMGPISVTLSSLLTSDSIAISLDETSTPGVFESGEISLVDTDSGAPNELVVDENDSITASYEVNEDETLVASATILPFGIVPAAFPGAPPSTSDPIRFVESNVYFVSQGATIRVTDASIPSTTNSIPVTVKSLVGSGPTVYSSLVLTATRDGPGMPTFTTSPLLSFAVVSSNPSSSILALPALPAEIRAERTGVSFVASATVINDPSNQPINPTFVPDTAIREVCASSDPENGIDSDADGACDLWEISTGASAGLRIPTTQAGEFYTLPCVPGRTYTQDPSGATVCPVVGKPDLYLEIDCMLFQCPSQTAINNVVTAFRNSPVRNAQGTIVGVQVHAFLDDTQIPRQQFIRFADPFNTIPEPTYQDLYLQFFGSNSERTQCNTSIPACVDQIERMLTAKRQVFRHGLFALQQFENPDSSGYGERPGNQFLTTLFPFTGHAGSIGQQEATLMHELGHTLSLRHGGPDDINYKPNHPSVINYLYQFDVADGGLVSRPLDFSRSTYTTINEQSLSDGSKILGISRNLAVGGIGNTPLITSTGTPIDWNRVSGTQTAYSKNVHHFASLGALDTTVYGPIPGTSLTGLRSQVDWNNLLFNVRSQSTFDNGMFTVDGFDVFPPVDGGLVSIPASKDSYLRKLFSNTNEGDNESIRVAYLGSYRSLVAFDQPLIADAAAGKTLESAKLNLYINFNLKDWGSGRDIEARPLLSSWTEGNGYNELIAVPKVGTGSGVTWNCATDSNISNYKADCSSKWNGGKFGSSTSKVKITNGLSGWVSFDVTSDVKAFLDGTKVNNGWIIKKVDEGKLGMVSFSSSESSSNKPELVLTFAP